MFEYQKSGRYFAQVSGGIEELAADELSELGATSLTMAYRGIHFESALSTLYRINYCSRIVTRVLAPLAEFPCHSTKYLYGQARQIPWEDLLSPEHTFAIFSSVSHSKIKHSQYAGLKLKDAIVDYFRDKYGRRPSVDKLNPSLWINIHIENNYATISLDTSGGSLHRRGYRQKAGVAPMQETVAAALIRMTGWDGKRAIYDPFCGSGTLLAEALMVYCNIPAGFLRKRFGFEYLPDFERSEWALIKEEADRHIRKLPAGHIAGSDISGPAIGAAKANLGMLPYGKNVELKVSDFRKVEPRQNTVLLANPPYGIRLGDKVNLQNLYKDLGDVLKQRWKGSEAYIYFGERDFISKIGLRTSWKKPLNNGGLDGRLAKFDLY